MTNVHGHGGKRDGAGAPPLPSEQKTKRRSINLTDDQWDHCFRLFNAQGLTASEYVRQLVEQDMAKHGKGTSLTVAPSPLRFVEPGPAVKGRNSK